VRRLVALVAIALAAWWIYRRFLARPGTYRAGQTLQDYVTSMFGSGVNASPAAQGIVTEGDGFTVNGV
jgi:hypothetical protein